MEQQTVTIAKAGMHASLNARCSVLAAANPVYGQYDRKRRIQENIGLPDSLLSRFDLLFIVLDQIDPEIDRRIAAHVIRGHRYRAANGQPGNDSDCNDDDDSDDETATGETAGGANKKQTIWQRSAGQLSQAEYTRLDTYEDPDPHATDVLQHDFLRKFIHFSKTRIKPVLTEAAREFIANRYAEMRSRQDERTLPITARSLETVIRLASAHAKARLSNTVEAEPDCAVAMDILGFALYHENENDVSGAKQKRAEVSDESGEDENSLDANNDNKRMRLDQQEELGSSKLSSKDSTIKNQIWDQVVASDGEMPLETACIDVKDREMILTVVNEMAAEGRLMLSDGILYQIG